MSDSVPMTEEGMAKIQADINRLEKRRPEIKKAIKLAREKGDLKENADYHAAREELGMLNARIAQFGGMLANAVIVDTSDVPEGMVVLGRTVTFKRIKDGKEITRTLVGAGQADPASGKILTTSPIGEALIGHEVGDVVTAELPGGEMDFEVLSVE